MVDKKVMSVRLDPDVSAEAELVARAEGVSMNQLVNESLRDRIERRRKDRQFMGKLAELVEADREILDRLAK